VQKRENFKTKSKLKSLKIFENLDDIWYKYYEVLLRRSINEN